MDLPVRESCPDGEESAGDAGCPLFRPDVHEDPPRGYRLIFTSGLVMRLPFGTMT